MTIKSLAFAAAALTAVALPTASANAATLIINVTGAQSVGALGTAGNTFANYNLGANAHITSVSYSVTINATSPSYLSEAGFSFLTSDGLDGVQLTPGFEDDNPGIGTYSGSGDLVGLGLDFFLGADGILRTEFFETFNDSGISPDAVWTGGTISITYTAGATAVPEPATWAMMMLGFGAIGAGLRRRTKLSVRYAA